MISAFLTGFFLGLSLIVAIGAQNTFVLKQGITNQHVFYVALFCALSDTFLIVIGVAGISFFLNNFIYHISDLLFGFAALWIFGYGLIRLKTIFMSDKALRLELSQSKELFQTLSIITVLTFANPHVYLDTMVLIGTVSQQFEGENKLLFTIGASFASFVFFLTLAYTAQLLAPIMKKNSAWRILDFVIALIMFSISLKLLYAGNWL